MAQGQNLLSQLAGREWISACHFHDLTEEEVLREVSRRVGEVKSRPGSHPQNHPLVLLDLDSTLYEVQPRTHQILKEWIASTVSHEFPKVRQVIEKLDPRHLGYSLADTLRSAGMDVEDADILAALKKMKGFWAERFFASAYLPYDIAYPGAAKFTRTLHELGAEIVYLTGRDEPGMGDGTRANLIRDGFPWNTERTHLLMKPNFQMPDLDHKMGAADYIRKHGTLVASFENEPKNLASLYGIFPEAMHVFVDTVYSDHEAIPRTGLYRIRHFGA